MNMLFADTMKKLREEKGLSQNEIAKRMYVTRTAVSRWESGHRLPDAAISSLWWTTTRSCLSDSDDRCDRNPYVYQC